MSTISPVNIAEVSPLTPQSPIDLNNPAPSHQPGPYSAMLSDHLFEGDLPKSNSSESNILAAGESLVIESLAQMREGVINEEGGSFVDGILGDSELVVLHPSTDSSDTDEDNIPLRWAIQMRMVPVTTKGKEKSSEITTTENQRRRRSGDVVIELSTDDVVDVSNELSEKESMDEDIPLVVAEKGKRETSQGEIQDNLHPRRKVLGRRVFDTKILTKLEQVQEFYYNVEFVEDGSLHTWVGNKNQYLDEELLEKILKVPIEGTRSVVGKSCSKQFVKKCSKLPDICCASMQNKIIKGEYQLLFEFVNKKRTVASSTDLFVIESLCKFEPLNLPTLMLEHMYKTITKHKGKHGMGYGHFLTKVFKHLDILVGLGSVGTIKQSFSLMHLREVRTTEQDVSVSTRTRSAEARIGGDDCVCEQQGYRDCLIKGSTAQSNALRDTNRGA
ncbi:hypothetical protein H5410_023198 [Solanum commersonii]|uniref:Uncharacterized protein n=1 Tax=Solanum commersonii TaxID=4109 RepID=A0A9J5ZHL3_SOLCO|nr:hypothetical protein H5410_023198 [Solanum commersonii]